MFWRSKSFDPNSDILVFSNVAHCHLRVLACFEDQRVSTQIALCLFSQWRTLLIKSIGMFWRSKSFDPNSDILVFSNVAHCHLRVLACFEDQRVSTQIALCLFSQWRTLLIKSIGMFWRSKSSDPNSNKSYDINNALFCRSNDAPCQLNTSDQSDPMKASICFQGEARISVLCRSIYFRETHVAN